MKTISSSGHLAHEGYHYHVGEMFAGKPVGLHRNGAGHTELHFANVHLGNLVFDPAADGCNRMASMDRIRMPVV